MDLDIVVINARHWTSKKDNKVYNTLDYIIVSKDNYLDTTNIKGYALVTSWLDSDIIPHIVPMERYKATFDSRMNGLKSTLILKSLTDKNGKTINLS